MASVTLKPGRERPLHMRHPWVFSGSISSTRGAPGDGDPVDLFGTGGEWLARGFYSGVIRTVSTAACPASTRARHRASAAGTSLGSVTRSP